MKRHSKWQPRPRPGWLELLTGGILLFLLLTGSLWSFSSAVGQPLQMSVFLGGCVLLTILLTVLCALPTRWMLAGMAGVLLLDGLAVWRLFTAMRLGEITFRCSVVNTVCTSLELDGFIEPILQLPMEVWIRSATVFALAVAAVLAVLLALAVVRCPSFSFTFLLTGPFVLAPLCISVTPAWPPLMVLILAWCVMGLGSLARRWDRQGAARLTLVSFPAVALLLLLLNAAMPQSAYQRPQWADDALDSINNWASHLNITLFNGKGPFGFGSGGSFTNADGKVSLDDAGPLNFSGRTVLEVDTDLRGRIYLRGFSSAVYDSDGWGPLEESDYQDLGPFYYPINEVSGQFSLSDLSNALDGYQPMNFPALADRNAFPGKDYAKVTIRNEGADPGYVYVPYHILSQPDELSGAKFMYDSYLARGEDVWTHTLYIQPGCSPDSGAALPPDARQAEERYQAFVYDKYLTIPDSPELWNAMAEAAEQFWPQVVEACDSREITSTPDFSYGITSENGIPDLTKSDINLIHLWTMESAQAVADYLASITQYDPNTPATPEGEDFVTYFLTESRRGYCMHYASAATLMLRAMGIPARYVTGYVADVPSSGHVNVPDSAAHAWVEVYIPGYGWEPVEVTPAYAGSNPGQSGTVEPTPTPTATPTPTP
ncbi:transglutaminase-like domain-containing protein, partial [Flavonifractor plautii]|uniref:transglutaminase-like domain-containing protein n=1 Tax=Flavonifractor plautii TaxID=292800 RepID=UPI00195C1CEE